ncbi:MAG: hypothetical protein JST27_11100 [Bacteroidetes bacterium]|nr:hypothetical protein [Bacteroidota bacterium]
MPDNITIAKNPSLPPGMDYGLLRRSGLQYIEALGSALWTDYNIHDPGITMLEALCYALTDLSYRTSFPMEDLLAAPPSKQAYPQRQGFFTAREILGISAYTVPDYRKMLADLPGVKNAWLQCKKCACDDLYLYADCKTSSLKYESTEHQVIIKGLYDVLIEFDEETRAGNLNSGKIWYNFSFTVGSGSDAYPAKASIELRLPAWRELELSKNIFSEFRKPNSKLKEVKVLFISGNKGDNGNILQSDLGRALRAPLFATLEISFWPDAANTAFIQTLALNDVPLNVWFHSDAERKSLQLPELAHALADSSASGIIALYLDRIHDVDEVMKEVRSSLHSHRNLCEDFCRITSVPVQEVAVCTDLDLAPDADIESVLAQAYFLIAQYMSPELRFWSLKEWLDAGKTVDEIFNGPVLNNGFIDNDQLAATALKTELRSSDVINLLMDIPGVVAVRNFVFSPFDSDGRRLSPESWVYQVPFEHQPQFYPEASKFLCYKNGLPFLPDPLELSDTLQVLKGQQAQPKFPISELDLPVPVGRYQNLDAYHPVQYELPFTYGVGPFGLSPEVSEARKAQAKQLKAYLLFFEQMLVNYLATLRQANELFAIDQSVSQTYFSRLLREEDIQDLSQIYANVEGSPLTAEILQDLLENKPEFLERRNRFLDHLLARFAEQFSDYTLMLYSYIGNKQKANETLIKDKVAFLKDFPEMSANRARSFNYKKPGAVCSENNRTGLQLRIARILGLRGLEDFWELYEEKDSDEKSFEQRWRLRDETGKIILSSSTKYFDPNYYKALEKAQAEMAQVAGYISDPERYEIKKSKRWVLNLTDSDGAVIATRKQPFSKKTDAEAARDTLVAFGTSMLLGERMYVVEHLLLRPHNRPGIIVPNGDALLPICIGPECEILCQKEDPYSFRLTLVMNGAGGLANAGIEYRRFAERSIRFELPAHLGLKICWVSQEQFLAFEKAWCAYLGVLAEPEPNADLLSKRLGELLIIFNDLKSIYPPASLHDCADGNDENRVFLNQSII